MAAPSPLQTVRGAIIACEVIDPILFNGSTKAERIALEIFDDNFYSYMDQNINELDEDLKSHSALTVNNGQIRITPGIKRNLNVFIQLCRDTIIVSENPTLRIFPVTDAVNVIRRYRTHEAFVKMSPTMIDTAKLTDIKDKTELNDWKATFENFLRAIPGRNGIPLLYIIRDNELSILDPSANMHSTPITG